MNRKVCVVVTARPSYSRIRTVLEAVNSHPDLELQLIVGASALLERYGSVINAIRQDGFKINRRIYTVVEGEGLTTMAKSTGLGLIELATVFEDLKPDVVLTIADRYETIATAIAASYMNIPVAHVQGGEITGSIDEKVRHAVTKLSSIHFVSNELSRERVSKMGEYPNMVFVTGCPSIDIANDVMKNHDENFNPMEKYGGVGENIDLSKDYIVVLQHPVTTENDKAMEQITQTLMAVHHVSMPTLWFWPNVDAGSDGTSKGIRIFREKYKNNKIHFFRNLLPEDFLRTLINSKCIIGNSSVAIRECSFLGVPAVNIGTRQNGRDRGTNVIDVNYDINEIKSAIQRQIKNVLRASEPVYGDGNAGQRIADLLATIKLTIHKQLTY